MTRRPLEDPDDNADPYVERVLWVLAFVALGFLLTSCRLAFPARPSHGLTARDLRAWCAVQALVAQTDTAAVRVHARRDGISIRYDADSLRCSAVTWDGRR